ncbi:MAG TPA: VOC family protein [Actinomycetota bacterium]
MKGVRLAYLYCGSSDVEADLAFYRDLFGAEVVWRRTGFGAEVAAVRLGEGPLILLADHRPRATVLQIWAVEDLDRVTEVLRAAGWTGPESRVEVPDGPVLLLSDPSGNELGLLEQVRPGILEDG